MRVCRVATELFDARGYDAITMNEVAAAAGISRRALFNHFPSKSDLLWTGVEPFLSSLRRHLAGREAEQVGTALVAAISSAIVDLGPDLAMTRIRLRIIAEHPALAHGERPGLLAVYEELVTFLSGRAGADRAQLEVRAQAAAVTAAVFFSLLTWASGPPSESAPDAIRRGLAALAELAPSHTVL
ncbi:TetR/AcrR family transcriptional regulator [Cryptosporangium aurantiacum]|uniref:Transcriptional regulator, TetR family n=1 Tax=Cryptosporangium aurantiacum TaxID=134849 RepID=A0A1M7PHA3_9ACTN|nr:TetR/AcrR family transcriptional regulator [Cryptosporangium aurantiacum]SHN16471.1 transcriptional regulator, TetR family [Cryptosporangium aurantiacum]